MYFGAQSKCVSHFFSIKIRKVKFSEKKAYFTCIIIQFVEQDKPNKETDYYCLCLLFVIFFYGLERGNKFITLPTNYYYCPCTGNKNSVRDKKIIYEQLEASLSIMW